MVDKDNSELTDELVNGQFSGRDTAQDIVFKLAQNINRECLIMGPVLNPHYFNNANFVEALTAFATLHHKNIIKILIENSTQVIRENGRLITLGRRLSENLQIRSTPEEYQGQSDLFIISDKETLLLQSNVSNPDITINVADKTAAAPYVRRFKYAWQRSVPMQGLHTFGL